MPPALRATTWSASARGGRLYETPAALTLRGPLTSVLEVARSSTRHTPTPDNIWPVDRSWLLTTDWDLWGTRIAGPPDVIAAIEADPELETVHYPHDIRSC